MNILFDPNPFCFGSTSTMRAILPELADASIRVLATGVVHDLCGDLLVEDVDVRRPASLLERTDLLKWADVYVAISNNTNVETVCAAGVPLVFIDVLYWMKRQRMPAMERAQIYLIENYPGVDERLASLPTPNARRLGPILHEVTRAPAPDVPLMVSVGGGASPHLRPGRNTTYPQRIVDLADRLAERRGLGELEVAMGSSAARSTAVQPRARAVTLPQDTYLERLARSAILLTAPGLNGPLEAFRAGVPVAWLPPQNLTQVFHLEAYVAAGLAPRGLSLAELCPGFSVEVHEPESVGTSRVLEALASLDEVAWDRVARLVAAQVLEIGRDPDRQRRRQRAWLDGLGPNGAQEAASAIREVVR